MDFYKIKTRQDKGGITAIYADWIVKKVSDLLVNSGSFQAVWNETTGLWSSDQYELVHLVDRDLATFASEFRGNAPGDVVVDYLESFGSKAWMSFQRYMSDIPENRKDLDARLTFSNTETKKTDYVTKRLPYSLEAGSTEAWDELAGTLYSPEELAKIEWAIGAIVSGDSVKIQKFLVFYGKPGSGKSTILDIIMSLFEGYTVAFNAKELTSSSNQFALAPFSTNPLVAIQHDGDLSRIEDNTLLNMITAHENVIINAKYATPYEIRANAFLMLASNEPVRIKNAKAGLIRRLIDVVPSGNLVPVLKYHQLRGQIDLELGGIAYKCLQRYKEMGKNYYLDYVPVKMQFSTDSFFNYVEAHHDVFKAQNGVTLKQAWELYKAYCDDAAIPTKMPQYKFRSELENYFEHFHETFEFQDGTRVRSYFEGYKNIMNKAVIFEEPDVYEILLESQPSAFDVIYADQLAQPAKQSGYPGRKWAEVETKLKDLDTRKRHWVKVPTNHIVIDFDLVDEDGEKDLAENLREASQWPPTYTEVSSSGKGVHLHYLYTGDVEELRAEFSVGIEVKTLLGDSALRRQLTVCNDLPIATISSGLPKKEKKVIDVRSVKSEKALRELIERNLAKEIHPGTKPSVDFIHKILEDAYEEGLSFDIRDMRSKIIAFAMKSSNQKENCLRIVRSMRYLGKDNMPPPENMEDAQIVFFDVEVFQNLFVVCWKVEGSDKVVRMINPRPHDIEPLLSQKLVGFYNRNYDNHILYARFLGHDLEELYKLSQKLIGDSRTAYFGEAFELSWADIYDISSEKKSLKKWEIELGIKHMELDIPWDEPVPEELWYRVAEYCANDVVATEAVWAARKQDVVARQILAELSGLSLNHTTPQHTARIIFGQERYPQKDFVYTDLSTIFEGYVFAGGESTYRGEVVGEGGYVYAEPGIYSSVALLDVASMHPTSIEVLKFFGRYTEEFSSLKRARLAIKHKEYETARGLLGGRLRPFLANAEADPESAAQLAYALKIVINIVYGLTSAKYDNPFRDLRNVDNIVAKYGALFMIELKHMVQEAGYTVAHIKTDSIKIPNADAGIIQKVMEFGKRYGFDFEHEATYDRFCLVNDAVYVAVDSSQHFTAVGKQFQEPYVYKTLFPSEEDVGFTDLLQTRSVNQGSIYMEAVGGEASERVFIGRVGVFVPVASDGYNLWRVKDGKDYAVTGTKGYQWITQAMAEQRRADATLDVDYTYFDRMATDAVKTIEKFGSFDMFVGKE